MVFLRKNVRRKRNKRDATPEKEIPEETWRKIGIAWLVISLSILGLITL